MLGRAGELTIVDWLSDQGYRLLPIFENLLAQGKGPRTMDLFGETVTPDILSFRGGEMRWFEVKTKSRFTWYGRGGYWTTGLDERYYDHYRRVEMEWEIKVTLIFLHVLSDTWLPDMLKWGAPVSCPTGIYMADMKTPIDHFGSSKGTKMVYFALDRLLRVGDVPAEGGKL